MPKYEFIAVNEAGQKKTGQAEGSDSAAVRNELRLTGWTVFSINEIRIPTAGVSTAEAALMAQHLVTATQAGLPLSGALRALSEEASSRRFQRHLKTVCEALEHGEPLEKVLLDPTLRLPPAIAKILGSGLPLAAISQLLIQQIQSAGVLRELRAKVLLVLAYPACLMFLISGMWLFMVAYVTPLYSQILDGFGVSGQPLQKLLMQLSMFLTEIRWEWWACMVGGVVVAAFLSFRLIPAVVQRRMWCSIPFVGSMYRLAALSDLAETLAVLIACEVPLPQALVTAADQSRDPDLGLLCRGVSNQIRGGTRMEVIIAKERELPAHLEQILRWTARGQEGCEALQGLAIMLRVKSRLLAQSAIPLLEPIMMITSVLALVFYAVTVLTPVFKLLNLLALLA
ncbi:MAG: gspF [Planctomycetaceae bacterium]|nr:gspF [Planctomycetaceae bacterium]